MSQILYNKVRPRPTSRRSYHLKNLKYVRQIGLFYEIQLSMMLFPRLFRCKIENSSVKIFLSVEHMVPLESSEIRLYGRKLNIGQNGWFPMCRGHQSSLIVNAKLEQKNVYIPWPQQFP